MVWFNLCINNYGALVVLMFVFYESIDIMNVMRRVGLGKSCLKEIVDWFVEEVVVIVEDNYWDV